MLLAVLLACSSTPPTQETLTPQAAEAQAEALLQTQSPPPEAVAPTQDEGAVVAEMAQVVLVWESISPLYQSFFTNTDAVTDLSEGLGPWLTSPVDVTIRYNQMDSVGDIFVQLRPGQLKRPVRRQNSLIALQDLAPITTALATYRSTIAANFDFRVESFRVRLESYRGARVCQFSIAGVPPPDGRLVDPCVSINGQSVCGQPTEQGVQFPAETAASIAACLDL